jgi:cytochrome c553
MELLRRLWPVALVVPVLALVWVADAQVTNEAPVGRALAANCFQCHGSDGIARPGMPSIAGTDAPSMYGEMREYKEKTDYRNIMVPIAHAYTDQQLWEMSLYIASLPEHPDQGGAGDAVGADGARAVNAETGGEE